MPVRPEGGKNMPWNNTKILKIISPQDRVGGPHAVVYKQGGQQRYAIVAMDWESKPRLGIRWFWDKAGNPNSRGFPTWFVIPPHFNRSILSTLSLNPNVKGPVRRFLAGNLSGSALAPLFP